MIVYKLFKNGNVKVLLDMSYNLDDVIESLGYCIDCTGIDYTITINDGTTEREYMRITSVEDYVRLKYIDNRLVLKKQK